MLKVHTGLCALVLVHLCLAAMNPTLLLMFEMRNAGIGYELCVALVNAGADVIAVTRTQADLDKLQKQVQYNVRSAQPGAQK